jgi:hypothetical protein
MMINMKKILIYTCLLTFCLLSLLGCKKEQQLEDPNLAAPVKLEIKGLILVDTLQFLLDGKVIGQGIDGTISISDRLYQPGQKIQVRKKSDSKQIGELSIAESPFKQVKKIFYDGVAFTDKIDLTPVSDPNNMGIRVSFSTTFGAFYGGPVDVELLVRKWDFTTGEMIFTDFKVIKNVTSTFSEFVELPPLESTDTYAMTYAIKVYKAGTKEIPYTNKVDLSNVYDLANNHGTIDNFIPGDSQLLSIAPATWDNFTMLSDGYNIQDYSAAFK